jgi:hypothetical protein
MTNEQINIIIAEACGWQVHPKDRFIVIPPNSPHSVQPLFSIPNYCNDLNALHEAEKVLTEEQMAIYAWEIDKAFPPDQQDKIWFSRTYCFVHATAKQRAEAFLRTLGKWEGAK